MVGFSVHSDFSTSYYLRSHFLPSADGRRDRLHLRRQHDRPRLDARLERRVHQVLEKTMDKVKTTPTKASVPQPLHYKGAIQYKGS